MIPVQGVIAKRRASNPRASAWVDASAGTGKTTVLTDRVVRLLLDGAAPGRILCITFTRAAAAEMSMRVINRLGQWAIAGDAELTENLWDLTGERPDAAMQTRARQLFARIVDAPAGFRIQTIHAFCQSVLRRFPLEAGIAPHFDLLDDRTGAELLTEARQSLLIDAGRDPDGALGRALALLVEYMDERGFADLIQAVVACRRELSSTIAAAGGVGLLIPRMWRGLGLEPGETAESLLTEACHDDAVDCAALRRACVALGQGTPTDQGRAAAIGAWIDAAHRPSGWAAYIDQLLTKAGEPRKPMTKVHKAIVHLLEPEVERLLVVLDRMRAAGTARATEAMLVLADALFARYAKAKEVRALLDYDDLVDLTRRLVESDAAWVLYKLDGGIDHLLLDEAQDTNPEQWGIVKALATEFFAGLGARDINRTIFVVGDGKQSIYSFQGADPSALGKLKRHFEGQLTAIERTLEAVDLTKSYRSTKPVLDLVDAVFADPQASDGLPPDSNGALKHDLDRIGHAGVVELWPVLKPDEAPVKTVPWRMPERGPSVRDPEDDLANKIAATIQAWIASGETIGGKPIGPGDVMILVRRRTRFVAPMVRALKKRGVPVAGVDRLALTEPLAIRDLMALGRFLLLPEDDLTLAALLKSPLIGVDEEQLFTLAHGRKGSLWSALLAAAERDAASFEPARRWLAGRLAEVDFARPFELYAGVLAAPCPGDPGGSGRRALWRRLGPDALDPLDEFLSAALDYEKRHAPTLEGYIGWLEASDAEIKRELAGRADAVRIVTVHGAKGLESSIVILPDTMQIPAGNHGPALLWHEVGSRRIPYWCPRVDIRPALCFDLAAASHRAAMQEYRRLLYVALTRARDRLYICGWQGKRTPDDGHWYGFVEAGMRALGAHTLDDGSDGIRLRVACPASNADEPQARSDHVDAALEPLPDWARLPPPSEPRPFRPLTPSRVEAPDAVAPPTWSPIGGDDNRRFRSGRAIHRMLQILPEHPPADRGRVGERLVAEFPSEERSALVAEALSVMEDPAFARLFGPSSRAEVPIVGRIGLRGVAGQIDRLLVEPGQVTIVDFKSGRIPPDGPEHVPAAYLVQMAAYRAVVRQIYPERAVDLLLVWTDGPFAVTLDPASLDPFEAYLTAAPGSSVGVPAA